MECIKLSVEVDGRRGGGGGGHLSVVLRVVSDDDLVGVEGAAKAALVDIMIINYCVEAMPMRFMCCKASSKPTMLLHLKKMMTSE